MQSTVRAARLDLQFREETTIFECNPFKTIDNKLRPPSDTEQYTLQTTKSKILTRRDVAAF